MTSSGRYVHSADFPALLRELGASLLVTTDQAGKLIVVRAGPDRLTSLLRSLDEPTGMACDAGRLAIGTHGQIWFWHDAPDLATQFDPSGSHDACFVPRSSHVTGDIRVHEMAWAGDELWVANTRFSCLCTLHSDYSFVPRWFPPFITALAAEDRCHLNGLAMAEGRPRYVTVLGETDTPLGWRPHKAKGGCVIDVASGAVVARGLCVPHSPRVHDGQLWVLDSGSGRVLVVDHGSGRAETVASLPGFVRGLAFSGRFAFVGLSRIRETAHFGGLPIAERPAELRCGLWVLDVPSGQTVGFLEFEADIDEIFDVQVLAGCRFPNVIGLQKEIVHDVFVLPSVGWNQHVRAPGDPPSGKG
jgi:uncharacterized protein (TIGR03032 family)